MSPATADRIKNIVLVHGGFVDGSGWLGVYQGLKQQAFSVSVVQNPTTSLADDVRVTRRTLAQQDGPVILVGHSYGGAVITEAGNDPIVAGLVYVAAFAPDTGESVASLIKDPLRRLQFPQSCRLRMAISSWTRPSLPLPLPPMSILSSRRSWRMLRSRGVSNRFRAQSDSRPGSPSRAGISSPRKTG
jgi:pimeloyl-ACP methyl ester carboxylesterase